ncbi:MAG: glycosyltransferase [Nitrospirae bacterium]|nr:glycosyltransferase [Nitrospirota bacterium]
MLNKRSDFLVILIATFNRLDLLKLTLESIASWTKCSHEVIVIDGGSTDGTIEYLESNKDVTPFFQGALIGTSRAYNQVWKQVESKYTCWLSDDTEIVNGSLDMAINLLENKPEIGMVGLKMKDTVGPWKRQPYGGGLSEYGILTCNHGVLSMELLRSVGFFNELYRSYTIDTDLTASVLSAGKSVVMTKHVSVLHHREYIEREGKDRIKQSMAGIDNAKIYAGKFKFLGASPYPARVKNALGLMLGKLLFPEPDTERFGLNTRDWTNLTRGRFISVMDPVINWQNPYHLTQKIPRNMLGLKENPYVHICNQVK